MKNSTAILGAIAIAFAVHAQAAKIGALERPRGENVYLQGAAHTAHISLNRVVSRSSRSVGGKTRLLPQSAIGYTKTIPQPLRNAGTAPDAPTPTASLFCGRSTSARAPPLA